MTRRPNTKPELDLNLARLLKAETETVTIFGKSWPFQVERILGTTLEENLKMITDSVRFLRNHRRKVIFDAEHFFDGFKNDPDYALSVVSTAQDAGASTVVLCDTRGAAFPTEVYEATSKVLQLLHVPVGVHCHNDRGMATADTLFAVRAGASHVQGTMNGLGERVGNADLVEIVANLHLMGAHTKLKPSKLTSLSRFVCEMSGIRENQFKPFVGKYAFAHKGGVHGDAVLKSETAYEFYDPPAFGNQRFITVSSQAGRSSLLLAAKKLGFNPSRHDKRLAILLREVKHLESLGCNLENAEATLELLIRRTFARQLSKPLEILGWEVTALDNGEKASARSKLRIKIKRRILETQANGNGPVNALDQALRLALGSQYKHAFSAKLTGYRVREIDSEAATAAQVAVYIDFTDGHKTWTTVASSTNIIQASATALADGYAYGLYRQRGHLQS
jgi:2-isopropylmalate synthase